MKKPQKRLFLFLALFAIVTYLLLTRNPCYCTDDIIGAWTFADTPNDIWWVVFDKGGSGFIATSDMSYECDKDSGELVMLVDFTPPPVRNKIYFIVNDYLIWGGDSGFEVFMRTNP